MKPIIVAKFGGTSVSSKNNIQTIADIVATEQKSNSVVVVVSALSKVTDLLLATAAGENKISVIQEKHYNLIRDLFGSDQKRKVLFSFIDKNLANVSALCKKKVTDKKSLDTIVSFGEIMSSCIVAAYLSEHSILATQAVATSLITTDNNFGSAEFLPEPTKKQTQKILMPMIKDNIVPVITGFIGATKQGETTTLGRGGSDYSGSIIGFALGAKEVQIWTDVDGVFTADPRIVKTAHSIPEVSYQEASEMAFLGAKVLHPRTMRPAVQAGIPVRVLNTFNPLHPGTSIALSKERKSRIAAITFKRKVVLLTIKAEKMFMSKGFLAKIFDIFREENISLDLVSVSEVTISLTLDMIDSLTQAISRIEKFARVVVDEDAAVVSVIGEHIGRSPHAIKNIFNVFDDKRIRVKMISFSAQNRNISCVIKSSLWEEAVLSLHKKLLEGEK